MHLMYYIKDGKRVYTLKVCIYTLQENSRLVNSELKSPSYHLHRYQQTRHVPTRSVILLDQRASVIVA